VYDFHALRHPLITDLVVTGVYPKDAQVLARHSTITLTLDRYTHIRRADLRAAASEYFLAQARNSGNSAIRGLMRGRFRAAWGGESVRHARGLAGHERCSFGEKASPPPRPGQRVRRPVREPAGHRPAAGASSR
jgi:hypothetical protein